MEVKVKITYFDVFGGTNAVMAKIIRLYGWYDLQNQLSMNQIQENAVLRIDVMIEAGEHNTIDTTENE